MGLTPLEGVMMGTRAGSIDPGILLHTLRRGLATIEGLHRALEHESGLLGVSGTTSDVRRLEADAEAGDARAALALRLFARRAAAGIAAAATALPRVDAIVFTGGIGEHASALRHEIVDGLAAIGVRPLLEGTRDADGVVSAPGALPVVLRVEAREDLVAARYAESALATVGAPRG
jgi:acetate kinase